LGLTIAYTGTNNGLTMAQDIFALGLPPTRFAHLHGDHAHMEWHQLLNLAGHTVTPILTYQTRRITAIPPEILPMLHNHSTTLLFSAGTASHLANLMKHANIPLKGTAIALSPATARAAAGWPKVLIAETPTLDAMIQTLNTAY
jgi:hypothetical protein